MAVGPSFASAAVLSAGAVRQLLPQRFWKRSPLPSQLTQPAFLSIPALQLVAPTVALLEGGYNLLSTAKGTEAVVRTTACSYEGEAHSCRLLLASIGHCGWPACAL